MYLGTKNVTKKFGGLIAVNDVSFSVEKGEIFGLIGPNGAGKTTLLNVVSGIYKPESGSVIFRDGAITGLKPHVLARKGITRTFQIVRSFPKMTVLENVKTAVVFGNSQVTKPEQRAIEVIEDLSFDLPINTLAENLNTVQLKYLELARALAAEGEVLLLDEMAAGLTTGELDGIINVIKRIRDNGKTIIIIEHVMKLIMDVCDRIMVLSFGEKIAEGAPCDIAEDQNVVDAYLGEEYI